MTDDVELPANYPKGMITEDFEVVAEILGAIWKNREYSCIRDASAEIECAIKILAAVYPNFDVGHFEWEAWLQWAKNSDMNRVHVVDIFYATKYCVDGKHGKSCLGDHYWYGRKLGEDQALWAMTMQDNMPEFEDKEEAEEEEEEEEQDYGAEEVAALAEYEEANRQWCSWVYSQNWTAAKLAKLDRNSLKEVANLFGVDPYPEKTRSTTLVKKALAAYKVFKKQLIEEAKVTHAT
jgi:hypothetical protein